MIVDLALAFLAGLLSFASTCVLPLVPAYVTYMGAAAAGTTMTLRQQLHVLGNAALFVAGFASAFVALGASFGLIGADLKAYRPLLLQVAGVALVLIGIALLALGRIPGLMGEKRFDIAHRLPRAPWASYVIGLAFAIGWTPCVGPILAAILLRAGSSGTAAQGARGSRCAMSKRFSPISPGMRPNARSAIPINTSAAPDTCSSSGR